MTKVRVKHLYESWAGRGEIQPKQIPLEQQINKELEAIAGTIIDIKFALQPGENVTTKHALIIYEQE